MIGPRKLFGANVRARRTAKGLSQEALAYECNLHRTYLGSIERGERNVSIDNMERIAAALAVRLPDLLTAGGSDVAGDAGVHLVVRDIGLPQLGLAIAASDLRNHRMDQDVLHER